MALGHALLHPGRLRQALNADAKADNMTAGADIALAMAGFGDPGPAAEAWAAGVAQRFQPLGEKLGRIAENGPLAALLRPLSDEADILQRRFESLLNTAATLDADALRRALTALIDEILAVLPDLRMRSLRDVVHTEINAALGILEQPLRDGRRDAAAHRAFRTAAEIRRRLSRLEEELPPGVGDLDLKVILRAQALRVLNALDATGLGALTAQLAAFRTEFGPLFSALSRLSVRVEVRAEGPQTMATGNPDYTDEPKVTPFPRGHPLWLVDLITGAFACFNLLWETIRTRNFSGRGLDGAASVLLLIWQIARMVVRIGWPNQLSDAASGKQWLFSDQGDFVMSVGLRFLMAFHEIGTDTNFVGSVLIRALKHVTAVSQPRMIYQWTRALWYLDSWKKAPEATRADPDFLRVFWAAWGSQWATASLGGLFPPWEDFHLEGPPGSLLASLIIALALGAGGSVFTLTKLADWRVAEAPFWTRVIISAFTVVAVVLVAFLLAGLESGDSGLAVVLLIVFAILLVAPLALTFLKPESAGFTYWLIITTQVLLAATVPFALWWVYIDDGRDKPGLFDGLKERVDSSPYRLPYPEGENWMCSQGTHGIFSHHTYDEDATDNNEISESNHYAYDFNENEGKTVVAARDGIVISVDDHNPNRGEDPNSLDVMHLGWHPDHDSGTNDERQLNAGTYFHVLQHSIAPALNQPIARGQQVALVDSTGRSAQHHIHFAAMEHQRAGDTTTRPLRRSLPFVFGDESTKQRRQYPLLGWIGGKGKIAGKPIAYAFYESDNAPPRSAIATSLEFSLAEPNTGTPHFHRVVLPASVVAAAGDAVIMAQPSFGHTHEVSVPRAMIDDLLRGASSWPAAGLVVAPGPDGHTHPALRFPLTLLQLDLEQNGVIGTSSGEQHTHNVTVDFRRLLDGAITPQTLISGQHSFAPPLPAGSPPGTPPLPAFNHTHQVTLQPAALISMLHRRAPAATDVTVAMSDAHAHAISGKVPARTRTTLPGLTPLIVAPPTGRMIADTPGPYRLMGEQAALRVNDRRTEAWMFGAHRAALLADVPAERGLTIGEPLQLGALAVASAVETRASPRDAARELTNALRAIGAATVPRPPHVQAAAIASPVLVIETRARGSAARLSLGAGSAALFGPPGPESRGAGDLPDLQSFTLANLVTVANGFLQNGWPTPPPGALNAFGPGGPVIDPGPSAPRTAAVLSRAIDPATNGLFPTNALPLQPGFVGVTAGFTVPILAAPAVRPLDLTSPEMTGAARTATPLIVDLNGTIQRVNFRASDNDAASVARRIMLEADGVRATPEGADLVIVSTIAGGADVQLTLSKGVSPPLPVRSNGISADLPGRVPVADTGAVNRLVLQGVVADAGARDTPPYDPAAVLPVAAVDGNRLRLTVAAGHTIRLAAQGLTLVPGSDPAGMTWRSEPMPAALALAGSSWLDIEVDGNIVRVPLTGEPARVELGPLPRLPAASEVLVLRAGGTTVTVTFDGTETNIGAVAERIAAASDQFSVRFAWQIAVVRTLHGEGPAPSPLQLTESAGLAVLGFLRNRTTLLDQPEGVFSDHLAAGPGFAPIAEQRANPGVRIRFTGPLSNALSVPAGDPPTLAGSAGQVLTAAVTPAGTDVLGFTAPSANQAQVGAALPLALTRGCVTWNFLLRQGAVVQARAIGQLSAMPAAIRATVPPAVQGALTLTLTVVRPDGASPSAIIDLAGVTDAIDACDRLMRVPGIAAFPVTFDDQTETVVVHIETVGRGTGWHLRLEGRAGMLALGFRPPQFDVATEVLEVGGGGTVVDGAAVTADEVRTMLTRAAATATGPEAVPPLYELTAPAGGGLTMTPSGDALSFRSQPPEAAAALGATAGAGGSLIIPPGPLAPGPALLQVLTGPLHTTLPVLAQVAVLRAPNPSPVDGTADATAQLTFLQTNGLNVQVDGIPRPVPASPDPFPAVNDAVEWINRHIAPGWAGLVAEPAPGAPAHLVLRGARRGNSGTVTVTLPAAPPGGLLGLIATATATGAGTFADVDRVTVQGGAGTLQDLLAGRAARPDIPQTLYRAVGDDAAGTVRLLPNGAGLNLRPGAAASSIAFMLTNGILEATPGPAVALRPEVIGLIAFRQNEESRIITGAFWGRNARLAALALPTSLAVLATRQLLLEVDGRPFTITLTAPVNVAALAAQIARGTDWTVRAFAAPAGLVLETVSEGIASRLILTAGNAVTGDPATGFVAPSPLPLDARGDGSVLNMASVRPSELAAALQAAWTEDTTLDDSALLNQPLDATAYAPDAPASNGFVIASRRRGVAGRLEFIAAASFGTPINWDDSLSRGAAERAAVALPAFAGTLTPNGPLSIGLDESAPADLPASRTIDVVFDGTPQTAAQVAARIHAALRAADAGAASAWPDGRLVIETAAFGLAGSVRIPATGAPRGAADILLQGGGDLFARGWPGAGRSGSLNTMTVGWRGVRSAATEAATYTFLTLDTAGATILTTNPVAIAAGGDPATIAVLLNNAFDLARAGGVPRIGLAGVVDGALCVEAFDPGLTLQVDGVALATAAAPRPGTTPELTSDKAFDMRRTDWVRTVRLTLAASDEPLFSPPSRDLEYLRPPAHIDTAQPSGWSNFPMGRWLVAVRPDAARAGDAPDVGALRSATAMVKLSLPIPGAALRVSPQIVRFWPSLTNGNAASLRGASAAGAEPFLVDLLTWQR